MDKKFAIYFTQEQIDRFKLNFQLFDRNGDRLITLDELKDLLVSVNIIWEDMEMLEGLYDIMKMTDEERETEGISEPDFLKILAKKKKMRI